MAGIEPGRLIVLAAPSGAGKTTLVHALLERRPTLKFSISYTTRTPRQTETHGEDYYFVSEEEFVEIRSRDAFLEYAEVFGNWYGTSEDYVQLLLRGWKCGSHVIVSKLNGKFTSKLFKIFKRP